MTLEYEISEAEASIKIGEKLDKDMSYEKDCVKNWKRYLKGGKLHHLWERHSYAARQNGRQSPQD